MDNISNEGSAGNSACADPQLNPLSDLLEGLSERARILDRIADFELAFGRWRLAERLSHRAAELREVAR